MKAVSMLHGNLQWTDLPDPIPQPGFLLTRPLACGICGSDLHARFHTAHLCNLLHRAGFRSFMDAEQPVVMGHEFCCEVIEPSNSVASKFHVGQRVVALPFAQGNSGLELLGYSNSMNGAFAEQMLIQSDMAFAVPDHVATEIAALTEPLSVAVHAVNNGSLDSDSAYAVVGCGPVGLFVIARLKALGLGPILAIEPNSWRAKAAERMGADQVLSSQGDVADSWWTELGLPLGLSDSAAVDDRSRKKRRSVIFDCVGKAGMLMDICQHAPVGAKVVVVGTCMTSDEIEPALLLQKSLGIQFVFAYSPDEFASAFSMICEDPDSLSPMITRTVSLKNTEDAFDALASGGADLKVIISPQS